MANLDHLTPTSGAPAASNNRYVLLAVLAFVVVVTVYLLKKNMEPPKTQGQPPPQEEAGSMGSEHEGEQSMQAAMDQVAHINDILAKDSSNVDAWITLGNIYFDLNMPEEAIIHYDRALALKPGDLHVMTDLATMKRAIGKPQEAIDVLNRVVAIDSAMEQAWFNLGVIYSFDLKNQQEALSAWKRFLALNPDSPHTDAVRNEIERLEKEAEL